MSFLCQTIAFASALGAFIFSELLGVMLLHQQEVSASFICNSEPRLSLLL